MELVEPKVYLIGESRVIEEDLRLYLEEIGAPEWRTDAPSDAEKIVEVMGRLCYRSFKPGMNPNITKVREGNDVYINHIKEVGHGSVVEHPVFNLIFKDVSRVFTHELVRHRVGVAISQESLRYVRLDKLRFWMPHVFENHPKADLLKEWAVEKITELEKWQLELAEMLDIDREKKFDVKKKLTSAMRRFAPIGLLTSIGWSANARALRHVIEMRTEPVAEEEFRFVMSKMIVKVITRYPNLFGDYEVEFTDGFPWYKTKNKKI